VFERFTERARQVVVLAQDEARTLRHNYIGTEHLLLGLLREEEGIPARVLESLDVELDAVRVQVARIVGQGDELATGQIPFTPRAKRVLELALQEALVLAHNYIGPEHLLLGLVRENEGVASRVLDDFGADAERVRAAVFAALGIEPGPEYADNMQRVVRTWARADQLEAAAETFGWSAGTPGIFAARFMGALVLATGLGILIGWLIWG
jgi:ATP-dependent Clp protease ATP-binding subunit ClpC